MRPILTFLSDFGLADAYVAAVKGVVLSGCPEATIVDISHEVGPQDVLGGALVLRDAYGTFPAGTLHLAVVDPGVGGERPALLARTDRYTFLGPDNGLLSPALALEAGVRLFHVRPDWPVASTTFHGRDLFAPAAARLLAGDELGGALVAAHEYRRLDVPEPSPLPALAGQILRFEGAVLRIDGFGNLITNLERSRLEAYFHRHRFELTSDAGWSITQLSSIYERAPYGTAFGIWGSAGTLELSVREGSAASLLGVKQPGGRLVLTFFEGGAS